MITSEDYEQNWELISSGPEDRIVYSDAEREEISVPIEMSDEIKMTGPLKIAILKEWIAKHDLGLIDDFLKLELEDIRELKTPWPLRPRSKSSN
ncbi:hypothetical protein [Rubinisphaera italica]|uniref:Uncharacterized protein n=1 Tax=Rubinisphaera italica TaxID=2527969 RepID=A0A5C5XL78_9PLAN|nr:hypothetical protein [Rubinisphaera italica]TWT63153.1 hypothetical protein Pan54_39060 [Rubinisphaera italica]